MKSLDRVHGSLVHPRRVRVLAARLAAYLPRDARVLDIGCGDGLLAESILRNRPDVTINGVDVLVRPAARIAVSAFDGNALPHADGAFDVSLLVDVLHHTNDPRVLLREASRVARSMVLKDHTLKGWLARPTLRFMDWVGNSAHGVVLPYNYWTEPQWREALAALELRVVEWDEDLRLYPPLADWCFGRRLHFLARLEQEKVA
jgi:SAM-dependent methyltransferase